MPIALTEFSVIGMDKLESTIDDLRDGLNLPDLEILGVFATFYEDTTTSRETWSLLEKKFEGRLLETRIPKNLDLEKAHRANESVLSFAPASSGGQAYAQLAREVKKLASAHARGHERRHA